MFQCYGIISFLWRCLEYKASPPPISQSIWLSIIFSEKLFVFVNKLPKSEENNTYNVYFCGNQIILFAMLNYLECDFMCCRFRRKNYAKFSWFYYIHIRKLRESADWLYHTFVICYLCIIIVMYDVVRSFHNSSKMPNLLWCSVSQNCTSIQQQT